MRALLVSVAIFGLVSSAGVVAQSAVDIEPVQETTDQATSDEPVSDRAAARQQRLQEYKDRVSDVLSAAEERRITAACKGAQAVVSRLETNVAEVKERREGIYARVSGKLNAVVTKVSDAGIDTTQLTAAITEFDSQVSAHMSAIDSYQTTINDLAEMDCEADPTAFKAALTDAKSQRAALVSASQAIKAYAQDTIKPILAAIRAELTSAENESEA